jgi:predicted ATPase/DNA-binding SARP family transcriptional activator
VKFGILGRVEAWSDEQRLPLGGSRQLALLSFLLLHANDPVPSDALIEGVWRTSGGGGGGAKRLSVAIARLRQALNPLNSNGVPILQTVLGGYSLSVPANELDSHHFAALVQAGRSALAVGEAASAREQLVAAIALWRGPALAEVRFEDFAQAEIRRLEELRLLALEGRIDADLQLGADAGLIGELGALFELHPTREHMAAQLMLALYRSGRQAEALDIYRRTRAYLTDQLGLEPGSELRGLQAQILRQAPGIDSNPAQARWSRLKAPIPGDAVTIVIVAVDDAPLRHQAPGEPHRAVVTEVKELLRAAWARRAAVQVGEQGDGLLGVFRSPQDALAAALDARDAAAAIEWPSGAQPRLRIAVHSGHVRISAGEYWGEDIHYAARVADAARGGQILVSGSTAALLPDAGLVDLGEHRLNDFAMPRHLFGLEGAPQLAPRTIDPLRSNLPSALGGLIGRDRERAELEAALSSGTSRLITITGPGGSGKTRLALTVAETLVEILADGAFLVALAQVREPSAVAAEIASALGIQLHAEAESASAIGLALSDRRILLVIDNFEHLLTAAPLIGDLLAAAPQLRVMVTSQAPLRIGGERVLKLGPLEVPHADDRASVASAAASRLLLERAQQADPGFGLTDANAASLARLCRALGGVPLAIELAAARLSLLSADELLVRLDDGFEALGRGPQDLPPRQRGLRAALDWTHSLLSNGEARLLRQLGVFAGPVSLERVEYVCDGEIDVLESLTRLLDLSLIARTGDGRLVLHASVRTYAREKLADAREGPELARRHGAAFADAAERWGSRFLFDLGTVQAAVHQEAGDIEQALSWAATADEQCFARLTGGASMPLLWAARLPPWSELIEEALERHSLSGRPRAWLLLAASLAAFVRADVELARARLISTLATADQIGDPRFACLMRTCSLIFQVLTGATDGVRDAYSLLSDRVALLRDDEFAMLVDGLEPYVLAYGERRHAEAGQIWAALITDRLRTDFAATTAQFCWPDCKLLAADYAAALGGFQVALKGARERAQTTTVAYQLEGIVMSLSGLARHQEALEAAGWSDSVRQTAGPAVNTWYKDALDEALSRSRAALEADDARTAYRRGRALTLDAAVNAGLAVKL